MDQTASWTSAGRFCGLAIAGLLIASSAAGAQDRPDSANGRFAFHASASDGSVLRLDRTTGQVSSCAKQASGWACYAIADERAALDAEIGRLQAENARLKEALLGKNVPLPGARDASAPNPGPKGDASIEIRGPGMERIREFADQAWKKAVSFFRSLQ